MSQKFSALTTVILASLLATGLSACGKSYSKLDNSQKAQVRETLDSTGRGVSAVGSRANNKSDFFRTNLRANSPEEKVVGSVFGNEDSSNEKLDPQLTKMNQKLATTKNCEFSVASQGNLKEVARSTSTSRPSSRSSGSPSDFNYTLKAEGKDLTFRALTARVFLNFTEAF